MHLKEKKEHEREKDLIEAYKFKFWDATSKSNAAYIEKYFHDIKEMREHRGARGAKQNSKYVYIFKWKVHILDITDYLLE